MKEHAGADKLVAQMKSLANTGASFQILSSLKSQHLPLMLEFTAFKAFIVDHASRLGLRRTTEFYFNFQGSGFTGIVCFNNSYIAVRTCPASARIDFDACLSDRFINNIQACEDLYRLTTSFFRSDVQEENYVASQS